MPLSSLIFQGTENCLNGKENCLLGQHSNDVGEQKVRKMGTKSRKEGPGPRPPNEVHWPEIKGHPGAMPGVRVRSQDNRACGRVGISQNTSLHTDTRSLDG